MKFFEKIKSSSYYPFRIFIEKILDKTLGIFLFQYERKDNMFNWFYKCLKYQIIENPYFSPKFNYYEFGVASGGSIKIYILALKKFCKDYKQDIKKFKIFAFDSFSGLPEAKQEEKRSDWSKGKMTHKKEEISSMLKKIDFPIENVTFIEGYFDKTLSNQLKEKLKKFEPSIINMDADYYSSTITALKWLGDLLPSGCFLRFDDIWSFYGHPEKGVFKAINDFNSMDFGYLTRFPVFGLDSYSYVFCKKDFEY